VRIANLPFGVVDWSAVEPATHTGAAGEARWRTRQFDDVRVRMVEYSAGYSADHWCSKGHFLLCLEGELETTLADGRVFTLTPGMSYQVADGAEPHRSRTRSGARLYVVD
jgi:quercetin dioxygenase-like cupin family protein